MPFEINRRNAFLNLLIFYIDEMNSLNVAVLVIKASVDVISGPMC